MKELLLIISIIYLVQSIKKPRTPYASKVQIIEENTAGGSFELILIRHTISNPRSANICCNFSLKRKNILVIITILFN